MNVVKSIVRFVPRCSRFQEPTGQEVLVSLVESSGRFFIRSPWAMVDAHSGRETTEGQLAALVAPCFATLEEATDWAKLEHPYWFDKQNDAVRSRLHDAILWHGETMGPWKLYDALGVSEERLRGVVTGKYRATAKEARLAKDWKGGPV